MATEEQKQQAAEHGWVEKEQWRGPEDRWVDADVFLQRADEYLPFLRNERERLNGELARRDQELGSLKQSLKAAETAIEALQADHDEDVKEQVEAARSELKAQLAKANEEGDHAGAAEIIDQMTRLNAAETEADDAGGKGKKPADDEPAAVQLPPEIQTWMSQNDAWLRQSTSNGVTNMQLAQSIVPVLRAKGNTKLGPAFLDDVRKAVDEQMGRAPRRDGDARVGESGSSRQDSGGGGKEYADLPPEAKQACDRQAARLVGPTRKHKTLDSWRKSYASQYFNQ